MAHIIRLGALTDELVTILTSTSTKNDPARFNIYRESALRSLRYHNHPRTNQFDVEASFEGLEEKFHVYNEDNLAEALRERLDELESKATKWTPEVLNLLLQLSDKPVINSKLESLELLRPVEIEEPALRWEDLVAEDPSLRDKYIWRNIDYGAESSEDDAMSFDSNLESSTLAETTLSSLNDDDIRQPESLIIPVDTQSVDKLREIQFWKNLADNVATHKNQVPRTELVISELQVNREVLFMLGGLPTTLFHMDNSMSFRPNSSFRLSQLSFEVFHGWLETCSVYGTSILSLRIWVNSTQTVPLLQSLQMELGKRLLDFDTSLSDMHAKLVAPQKDVVVSVVGIHSSLRFLVYPLLKLSEIIQHLSKEQYSHPFRCLELLFEETYKSQMAGDDHLYEFLGTIFFNCFGVYLCPIRAWMEHGDLRREENVFFISKTDDDVAPASLWQDRYILRKSKDQVLHAPNFLRTASRKIFTTGKSVVLLKKLGQYDITKHYSRQAEPKLDFPAVCNPALLSLVPFPALFEEAFESWVQSKHHAASYVLRTCLLDDFGLQASLDAMEKVYFMADGATSSSFTNGVFNRLDSGKVTWSDPFTLTELAQSTVGELKGIVADRLRASAGNDRQNDIQQSRKSVRSLATIYLTYRLPWPVEIIITGPTISSYQRVFTFLFQLRRASSMIESPRLLRDTFNSNSRADEQVLFYGLRARLLWFISTLYDYMTTNVIRVNTVNMRIELAQAEDIERMIQVHEDYTKHLVDQALLGSRLEPIHKSVTRILDLSIQLSDARAAQIVTHNSDANPRGPILKAQSRSTIQKSQVLDPDVSDEDGDSELDFSVLITPEIELSYYEELRKIRAEFDNLCKFVVTGLRGVSRAGGESAWDVLAEKLENGFGGGR